MNAQNRRRLFVLVAISSLIAILVGILFSWIACAVFFVSGLAVTLFLTKNMKKRASSRQHKAAGHVEVATAPFPAVKTSPYPVLDGLTEEDYETKVKPRLKNLGNTLSPHEEVRRVARLHPILLGSLFTGLFFAVIGGIIIVAVYLGGGLEPASHPKKTATIGLTFNSGQLFLFLFGAALFLGGLWVLNKYGFPQAKEWLWTYWILTNERFFRAILVPSWYPGGDSLLRIWSHRLQGTELDRSLGDKQIGVAYVLLELAGRDQNLRVGPLRQAEDFANDIEKWLASAPMRS